MKHLVLYFIANIFVVSPTAAVRPMVSLFAEELGASIVEIGMLTACYSLTPLFLAVQAGRFIDRVGGKLPLIIGSLGMILALIVPFLLPQLPVLFLSQMVLGGSQFLAFLSVQNGVISQTSSHQRTQVIATVSLFGSIGLMMGPLIGGYSTEHLGFQQSFLLFSLFSVILLILALLIKAKKQTKENRKNHIKQKVVDVLAIPGLKRTIIISMLILASLDMFYVYFPLYASGIGLTPSEIGWILAVQSFASVLTRLFMSKIVLSIGAIKTLVIFMFGGAIAYSFLPFFDYFTAIAVIAASMGFGLGMIQPLTIMITYNLSPSGRTAEVLSIRLAANRLSQVVIPLVFSVISISLGLAAIFVIQGIVLGTGAIFARGIKQKSDSEVHQSEN